jgi:hypothetical protein
VLLDFLSNLRLMATKSGARFTQLFLATKADVNIPDPVMSRLDQPANLTGGRWRFKVLAPQSNVRSFFAGKLPERSVKSGSTVGMSPHLERK